MARGSAAQAYVIGLNLAPYDLPSRVARSVKMAGGLSDQDARALAADMRTKPDFLRTMRKHRRGTEFACYIRNHTEAAMRVRVPFGSMEAASKMSGDSHRELRAQNRARYGVPQEPEPVTLHRPDLPWKLEPNEPFATVTSTPRRHDPDEVDMKPSRS